METPNPHVIYKAEGFAYPATYDLPEGATEKEILATMVKEFNRRLDEELKNQIKASGMSIRDVVNLAAMVEKEAVHEDEMPLIAGVFLNRLHKNMPIQSDTTIQYLLGHQRVTFAMMTLKWILRIIRTCILGFRQDRLQVPASRQSKLSSIPKNRITSIL